LGSRRHPVWVMTTDPAVRQLCRAMRVDTCRRAVRELGPTHAYMSNARMSATQSTPHGLKQDISPERLLVGYLIILFGLLVRAVGRAFGVSGEGSTLLTLVVIGSVARGVRRVFAAPRTEIRKARSSPNFAGNTMIATAAFKETVDRVAGRPSRDTSFAAALIVFAVLTHSFRPAVGALRKSIRAVITQGLRLRAWFAARGSMIAARSRKVAAVAAGRNPDAGSDHVRNGDR
jgi:hypothetical protein